MMVVFGFDNDVPYSFLSSRAVLLASFRSYTETELIM